MYAFLIDIGFGKNTSIIVVLTKIMLPSVPSQVALSNTINLDFGHNKVCGTLEIYVT